MKATVTEPSEEVNLQSAIASEQQCPICGAPDPRPLCAVDSFQVSRCAHCATDFVWPAPGKAELRAYYDRADWFEGGERGGYSNYDEQTIPQLPMFDTILDSFGADGAGLSVLDIGCGYGTHLEQAHRRGWKCFGVEVSAHAREVINTRHGNKFFISDDVEQLIPHEFDLIVLFDVIEHLVEPYQLFYTLFAKGSITPKTKIVMTTPNARSSVAVSAPSAWPYRHPPSHLVYFSAQTLTTLLRRLHFDSIEVQGAHEEAADMATYSDESYPINDRLAAFGGLICQASGSTFAGFMQERYVPGTWSKIAEYEHLPRYLFARELAKGRHTLDFGCGTGYGTALLAQKAQTVVGIDIDVPALQWAREHHKKPNLSYEQRADFGASLPEKSFEMITCFEMIEHVGEPAQREAVKNFSRLVTQNGLVLISTPNPEITKLYGANPYHIREMTKPEFMELLGEHFEFVEILDQYIHPSVFITPQIDNQALPLRPLSWDAASVSNPEPAVFIAICSNSPIAKIDGACFFDFGADLIADQLAATKQLNQARFDNYRKTEEAAAIPYIRAAAADKEEYLLGELKNRAAEINDKNVTINEQLGTINQQTNSINQQAETIAAQAHTIHSQTSTIDAQEAKISQLDLEIGGLNVEIQRLNMEYRHQATEIEGHRTTISTLGDQRQELERELSAIKNGNWYRLGRALKDEKFSLKKLLKIAYFFTACAVPGSLKPALRPAVGRLRNLYERKSNPTKSVAPQLIQQVKPEGDSRPRVLHVIGNFMLGGSSQLVVDLIQGLGSDYDQHVVTSHLPSPPAYSGVDVSEFRSPRSPDDVIAFLRQYDPSIIHFHYWGDVDWWWYDIFFRAAQTLNCRVIENVNTPVAPYKADCVDWYVHVSNYVKQQFGDGSTRNMTIYPGIDLSLFSRPENTAMASDCIGMVYRLETDKLNEQSIDAFIKVVQLRPQTKVLIIGGGTYLEPYRRATQDAGVAGNFEFTGYVDYAKLPELYQKINIFVAPVWKESFGQVTPFAMNFGITVAGYDVGGLREIIDDPSLLAEPGNSEELAQLVVRLLDDPERCSAIGARNHARAQSLFSVEAMVAEYRKLYVGLVEAKQ